MTRTYVLLPTLAALALIFAAPALQAATSGADMDWQTYEQTYGSSTPPMTDADCSKYATNAVKMECMNRMHHQPSFTYYAGNAGDSRANADQAAIRYCTSIGKTYHKTGESADMMIAYTCN